MREKFYNEENGRLCGAAVMVGSVLQQRSCGGERPYRPSITVSLWINQWSPGRFNVNYEGENARAVFYETAHGDQPQRPFLQRRWRPSVSSSFNSNNEGGERPETVPVQPTTAKVVNQRQPFAIVLNASTTVKGGDRPYRLGQ